MVQTRSERVRYLAGLLDATELPSTLIELPRTRRMVDVLTLLRRERRWHEPRPEKFHAVPNKPVLQFDEQPAWAEFILLRLLERDGWKGAWVKNWGGRAFWRDVRDVTQLAAPASLLFQSVQKRMGGRGGGCWDIFAWRGNEHLFIESKQRGHDRIRPTQRVWFESALEENVPSSSFVIVEWTAPPGSR